MSNIEYGRTRPLDKSAAYALFRQADIDIEDRTHSPFPQNERRDLMDSLHLELSTYTPSQGEKIRRMTKEFVTAHTARYKQFMPAATHEKLDTLPNGIIVTIPEDISPFVSLWEGEDNTIGKDSYIGGFTIDKEFALINKKGIYNDIANLPRKIKKQLIKLYINEANIRAAVDFMDIPNVVAHELSHILQGPGLKHDFIEIAARYYAMEMMEDCQKTYKLIDPKEDKMHRHALTYYHNLIQKYGEDVHRVNFGSISNDDDVAVKIQSDIYKSDFQNLIGIF